MRRILLLTLFLVVTAVSLPAGAAPEAERRAPVHTVGGCEVFPSSSPWNQRIDRRPVWKHSRAIVARQAAGHDLHLDLGTTEDHYGIPVNVVDEDQPLLPLQFGVDGEDYGDESDRGLVFVPADAAIEGGSTRDPDPGSGDRHVVTVRRGTCDLIELYAAERVRDSSGRVVAWRAAAAARWDLSSTRLRPAGWTSADAAGLPILAGLLRWNEVRDNMIDHAIRFTTDVTSRRHLWPARHDAGSTSNRAYPPMGARFRLKSSYSAARLSPKARIVVRAMKKYGLVLADNGSPWFFQGEQNGHWPERLIEDLKTIPASAFVAVDTSSLKVSNNTGEVR